MCECVGDKKPTADFFMRYRVGRFSAELGMSPAAFFDYNGLWRSPVL